MALAATDREGKKRYLGLVVALLTFTADQLCKWYLIHLVDIANHPLKITGFFNLVMVWNRGISFGMLADHGTARVLLLIALTLLIVIILLRWLWQSTRTRLSAGLGLVIGGALGNIIDRALYGAVADFFDFHVWGYHWPAFNIADSAIVLGVAILVWDSMVTPGKKSD